MTTFTIDNSHISVALNNTETYTPAAGEVQKLVINATVSCLIRIDGELIKGQRDGSGENQTNQIPIILDDTQTVSAGGAAGYHVSGFVIN